MAKLESLIVDLQANTAELKKGLDQANAQVEKFGKKIDSLAQVVTFDRIGHLALEASEKLGEFVLKGAEVADQMGKLSQAAGVPVETLSRLNYAAGLANVSSEELGKAFAHLNKSMGAAAGGASQQVAIFQALGIKVTDAAGKLKGADQVMGELAD